MEHYGFRNPARRDCEMASNLSEYDDLVEDCAMEKGPTPSHIQFSDVRRKGGQSRIDSIQNDHKKQSDPSHLQSVVDSGIGSLSIPSEQVDSVASHIDKLSLQDNEQSCEPKKDSEIELREAIFSQDSDGDNQVMIAVIQLLGDVACGMILKANSPDLLNLTNNDHQTVMHLAVLVKLPIVLQTLLENNASPEIVDCNGNTPLHIACREGDEKSISLLTHPTRQDVNALNFEGLSCLHLATLNNHPRVMHYLIKKCGANINVKDGKSGRTPLHFAAENNNGRLVEFLLNWEADIEANTFDNSTPLRLAGGRHNHAIVQLLMNFGADPDALTSYSSDGSDSDEEDEMDMVDDIRIDGKPV